jgi:hypothetical protein
MKTLKAKNGFNNHHRKGYRILHVNYLRVHFNDIERFLSISLLIRLLATAYFSAETKQLPVLFLH